MKFWHSSSKCLLKYFGKVKNYLWRLLLMYVGMCSILASSRQSVETDISLICQHNKNLFVWLKLFNPCEVETSIPLTSWRTSLVRTGRCSELPHWCCPLDWLVGRWSWSSNWQEYSPGAVWLVLWHEKGLVPKTRIPVLKCIPWNNCLTSWPNKTCYFRFSQIKENLNTECVKCILNGFFLLMYFNLFKHTTKLSMHHKPTRQ